MTEASPKAESKSLADPTTSGKRKPGLLERRYERAFTKPDFVILGAWLVASACAGAVTYASFGSAEPMEYRNLVLGLGVAALAVALYRYVNTAATVLVGDAGVALERGGEVDRLLWWEISTIRLEEGVLVLRGAHTNLRVDPSQYAQAAQAILREARERLPSVIDVSDQLVDTLPKPLKSTKEPAAEPVRSLQIAGKRCAVSKNVISVERDARLCPKCATVYHRERLPKTCMTCNAELGSRAVAP
ncbi:MAG: hypothetical protein QM784_38500 [Polyangiaceae bacterium]